MRVFMLGWEFPPYISGGLGTACYGLTRALDELGLKVSFVLPKPVEDNRTTHVKMLPRRNTTKPSRTSMTRVKPSKRR